ncbi:MAG: TonB-dependent receptor [Roseivirga sp.]|nr:TonB-dependent receptor [Roseivirga sp.]
MRYNILFFLLIWAQVVNAQFSVSGRVVDEKTNKPVPFATIALFTSADSSLVDGAIGSDLGEFSIDNVKSGTYRFLVRSIGYQDLIMDSLSISGNLSLGDLSLRESVSQLDVVVVTGKRSTVETQLGKKVLNIGEDLSTAGATVTDALQRLPSVSTDINGGVSIRGSSNVIIYVNGKETQRDTKSLQFLSAGALQKIEVITNPSAKYDAGGVGGIINLVFRKDAASDFKLETVTSISTPYRFSGGINAQVSSQKLTGYLSGNIRRSEYENREERTRTNDNGTLQRYENLVQSTGKGRTANLTAGLTYDIDTSFSLNFEYNYWRWEDIENSLQTNNFIYRALADESYSIRNWGRELEDEMSLSFSLDKQWSKDRSLKLLFNGGGEVEDNESRYNLDGLDLTSSPLAQTVRESRNTEEQALYQLTIDYTSPLKGFGSIETGVKFDDIKFEITQTLDFLSDELFLPQNDFRLTFKKYAGYFIHKMKWKRFEYGLGLRLEHFNSIANQLTTGQVNEQNVTRLFPSVQLVYKPAEKHQLAFNYSRRINRPGFFDLNPFVSFTDPLILERGNPGLEPEFAHNYELSYQLNHGKLGLDVAGFQRTTTNVIQQTVDAFDTDRLIYSYTNFGRQNNLGTEVSASWEPFSVLELTGNFSWYHTRFAAEPEDLDVRFNNQSTWQTNLQQRLNLKGDWSIELSQNYRAPRIGIQSEDQANYYVNAAIRKAFKNKRAVITINLRDMFDTRVFKTRLRGEDFEVNDMFKFQSRSLSLELRYKIFD